MSEANHPPAAASSATVAASLDEAALGLFHLKAAVTAGAGFFTDSYDLNVIGTVALLLTPQWHLSSGRVSMLTSASLLAVAVGALCFGRLGDLLGRRRIYGLEAVLMLVGALVSALAPSFSVLLIGRLILGIGIGGDYPASGVIATEYANRRNRGTLVGVSFLFYTLGQVSAYIVSLLLLAAGIPHDLVWRLILGVGVLPSLLVLYQRRQLPESPRWTAQSGDPDQALADFASFADQRPLPAGATASAARRRARGDRLSRRRLLTVLLGTAGTWFFFDVATYGISVSQPLLIKAVLPGDRVLADIAVNALLAVCFSLVGGIVGLVLLARARRRTQQAVGLGLGALTMLLIGLVPGLTTAVAPFAVVFGVSLFSSSAGANYTTILLAGESFPTAIRSTCQGLSSSVAKVGAFIGALVVPLLLDGSGLTAVTLMAAGCFIAAMLTTVLVPEPRGRSLDDLSEQLVRPPDPVVRAPGTLVAQVPRTP